MLSSNLIETYKLSNKYKATDLGTTNVDVFGNLTLAFFGGFFKYPTSASKRIGLGGSNLTNEQSLWSCTSSYR